MAKYYPIDSFDDFDFSGDDSPWHYATSVVYEDGLVAYAIAVLTTELELLASDVLPENDLSLSEILISCNNLLQVGKDTSTLVVNKEASLVKYAIMQIQWDEIIVEKARVPAHETLKPDWYPFHFNFAPLERKAWNLLVKVALEKMN